MEDRSLIRLALFALALINADEAETAVEEKDKEAA